jgi:proton-translocating NADH-quinone oxidoreductase chain M
MIPMFIIIGVGGNYARRIKASLYFFLFTFFGSLFLLFNLFFIFTQYGTLNYYILVNLNIPFSHQIILWVCFFFPFALKIPLFPFHIWLPEAHVEAQTSGSIMLAALFIKLGVYGLLRFILPLCPDANLFFLPSIYTLLIIGIIQSSLTTIRQVDIKRIIAYSSITHMIYTTLGLLTNNFYSLQGGLYLALAHGFSSAALFLLIGILYKRSQTRLLEYYSGIVSLMPIYSTFLFIFCLANFGFPLTMNFVGEFIILLGLIQQNFFIAVFAIFGIFCSVIYTMWFYNRLVYGNIKINYIKVYTDITRIEIYMLGALIFPIIFFGLFPNSIFHTSEFTLKFYCI